MLYYILLFSTCTQWIFISPSQTGSSSQEEVEEAAKEEIREIVEQKEAMERRKTELEAQRILAEKEREDMGVMWGMGE